MLLHRVISIQKCITIIVFLFCFRDTAGTEKYRSLAQSYYRGAHGIFIVYDITDVNALSNLKNWINDVKVVSNCIIIKLIELRFNLLLN